MAQSGITIQWLRAPHRGRDKWLSDGGARGSGRLIARKRTGGTFFSFRYSPRKDEEDAVPIGEFDEAGRDGLTLTQAREQAGRLAQLYRGGVRDLRGHLDREREAAERERAAAEAAARAAAERAQRGSLRQLLDAYIAHLRSGGKEKSARDVLSQVKCHIEESASDLLGRQAAEIPVEEFVAVLGRAVASTTGRTAAKLRSTLRAAYQLAIAARTDPTVPGELAAFGITMNPLASIGSMAKFNRARDRVLDATELGAFLRRVEKMRPGTARDALWCLLLLGGQRPVQMLRLERTHVDLPAGTVTLYDPKGRRAQPRAHVLPLVREAKDILVQRLKSGERFIFSTDGEHAMRVETLGAVVADIVEKMLAADPPEARSEFQLRDLRRTAETQLAGLKVSSDVRAQLLSHGLGGVQARHYDRHTYALEKKQALEKWARHLDRLKAGEKAKVISMERGNRREPT